MLQRKVDNVKVHYDNLAHDTLRLLQRLDEVPLPQDGSALPGWALWARTRPGKGGNQPASASIENAPTFVNMIGKSKKVV